jgi:hypothetical protein
MTHIVHYTDPEGRQGTEEIDLTGLANPEHFRALADNGGEVRHVHTIHPADQDCPRCRR